MASLQNEYTIKYNIISNENISCGSREDVQSQNRRETIAMSEFSGIEVVVSSSRKNFVLLLLLVLPRIFTLIGLAITSHQHQCIVREHSLALLDHTATTK